ncbi:MAG: Asp-tRNA(Asn)/Glu-tRNA(Gln) amidotransferase subunit GatA [Caldisericaceae bacterium]|nr:Asp-tRNA(Asn)/Glu-tRNA(Gln) amidotransferase subunit GatA [Caldisericaceae bacterium]
MQISDIQKAVRQQKASISRRVEEALKKIEQNSHLNAFTQVFADQARERAQQLEEQLSAGKNPGPLTGVIMAIKDNINIAGRRTTCASKILENFVSPFDATVIQRLREAGAIFIGKTNMDEFAMGSSSENSYFGSVKNPLNPDYVAGGSSGGSAVAVAIGACDAALGSETGGSIRQPASFTGLVGIKPTYGRVSRYGLVAYASSLDQIGVFARTVQDTAAILQIIAGHDEKDSTSAEVEVVDYATTINRDFKELKIGLPKQYFADGLDAEIREGILKITNELAKQGANVEEFDLPLTRYAIATYYIIATAEASSNLARYDGVRYGFRAPEVDDLQEMYASTRSKGFGKEVKRRILLGTYVLSAGYYDAYYKKAMQVRRLIKEELNNAFKKYDVIVTPTTPTTAFKLGEKISDPLTMYLMDIYTVTANLAGICAINLPAGKHSNGLPFGLQVMAPAFREERLFQLGATIERMQS